MLISFTVFGQRNVDLDKTNVTFFLKKLATRPFVLENRNYSVNVSFGPNAKELFDADQIASEINIDGVEKRAKDGDNLVHFFYGDVLIVSTSVLDLSYDTKDKNGNVTGRVKQYQGEIKYSIKTDWSVKNKAGKSLSKKITIGSENVYTFLTDKYGSYKEAGAFIKNNLILIKDDLSRKHIKDELKNLNITLTDFHGYIGTYENAKFWFVGDDEHRDYKDHQEIISLIKDLFKKIKSNESIVSLTPDFENIINRLAVYKTKYTGKTKHDRKMRYSALYNIARIYYVMENFEMCKQVAAEIVTNDYSKGDSKDFIKKADKEIERLTRNQLASCHFPDPENLL